MIEQFQKNEFFSVLEAVGPRERALLQALYFHHPEPIMKTLLIETLPRISFSEIYKLVYDTNCSLKSFKSHYRVVADQLNVRLEKASVREVNPQVWSAFSSTQRQILIRILSGETNIGLDFEEVEQLNHRLKVTFLGTLRKRYRSYQLEVDESIDPLLLLQSVSVFQQEYQAQKPVNSIVYSRSEQPVVD